MCSIYNNTHTALPACQQTLQTEQKASVYFWVLCALRGRGWVEGWSVRWTTWSFGDYKKTEPSQKTGSLKGINIRWPHLAPSSQSLLPFSFFSPVLHPPSPAGGGWADAGLRSGARHEPAPPLVSWQMIRGNYWSESDAMAAHYSVTRVPGMGRRWAERDQTVGEK